jgi:hypothetical protein
MSKFKGVVDGKLEFWAENVRIRVSPDYVRPCPACGKAQPLELRQTLDGVVRDQPYCGKCRGGRVQY